MRKINQYVISVLFLLPLICSYSALSQTGDDLLDRKLSLELKDADFITVLDELAVRKRVPIGLERSVNPASKISICVKETSVREILQLISEQVPSYQWRVHDGVVNFSPVMDRSSVLQSFLGVRVGSYNQRAGASRFELRDSLLASPEISDFFRANSVAGLKEYYPYKKSNYSSTSKGFSLNNTEVISVLNAIVKLTEFKIWVVELSPEGETLIVTI